MFFEEHVQYQISVLRRCPPSTMICHSCLRRCSSNASTTALDSARKGGISISLSATLRTSLHANTATVVERIEAFGAGIGAPHFAGDELDGNALASLAELLEDPSKNSNSTVQILRLE